jgi:hypothetical protein
MSRTNLFLDYMDYKSRIQKREHIVRSIYQSERVVEAVRPLTYAEYHNLTLIHGEPDRVMHQAALKLGMYPTHPNGYDPLNTFSMNRGQKG